jgi:L-cystine uptake protein TcyP (sodium:dicarboxylate symporter family)
MDKTTFLTLIIVFYILVCYLFSLAGKKREIGKRRLFWLSLFLTPVIGLAIFLGSQELKMNSYIEKKYKCERCGYVFSDYHENCPFCEKEGIQHELKPVNQFMT